MNPRGDQQRSSPLDQKATPVSHNNPSTKPFSPPTGPSALRVGGHFSPRSSPRNGFAIPKTQPPISSPRSQPHHLQPSRSANGRNYPQFPSSPSPAVPTPPKTPSPHRSTPALQHQTNNPTALGRNDLAFVFQQHFLGYNNSGIYTSKLNPYTFIPDYTWQTATPAHPSRQVLLGFPQIPEGSSANAPSSPSFRINQFQSPHLYPGQIFTPQQRQQGWSQSKHHLRFHQDPRFKMIPAVAQNTGFVGSPVPQADVRSAEEKEAAVAAFKEAVQARLPEHLKDGLKDGEEKRDSAAQGASQAEQSRKDNSSESSPTDPMLEARAASTIPVQSPRNDEFSEDSLWCQSKEIYAFNRDAEPKLVTVKLREEDTECEASEELVRAEIKRIEATLGCWRKLLESIVERNWVREREEEAKKWEVVETDCRWCKKK